MKNGSIHILSVEDNLTDAVFLREYLSEDQNLQHSLTEVKTLSEGIKRLKKGDVDVVLLDLSLPDSFGMETFHAIYAVCKDVPIILMTGLQDEQMALYAVRHGAQDYLIKGDINPSILGRSIRYAVERQQLLVQLRDVTEQVKVLKGIIPICASCKDIRDDEGFWHQMEQYIHNHSEAQFSHGICPKCAEKLYPEIFKNHAAKFKRLGKY
jgi:CheY-like chemotaxis protein